MKTNRRDAVGLAKLLRAGELTPVWIPDEGHEATRDLVRARAAAVETRRVHRQQVGAFMLKHGRILPRKTAWGARHLRWLQEQSFNHPAHQIALRELVDAVRTSKERVQRIEAAIEELACSTRQRSARRLGCSAVRSVEPLRARAGHDAFGQDQPMDTACRHAASGA